MTSKTNSFLNRVVNTAAWGDDTDSDSDDEPTVPVVSVPSKCPWAKVEQKPEKPEPVQKPVQIPVQIPEKQEKPEKPDGVRTLMVKNLPRDTTPEKLTSELRFIFKAFGSIKDVYIPINRDGTYAGTIKGFAKVQFHNADHSAKAVSQSITIRKNKLVIEYAKEDR